MIKLLITHADAVDWFDTAPSLSLSTIYTEAVLPAFFLEVRKAESTDGTFS